MMKWTARTRVTGKKVFANPGFATVGGKAIAKAGDEIGAFLAK